MLREGSVWGEREIAHTPKDRSCVVASVGAVELVQVLAEPHHECQLDFLLKKPACIRIHHPSAMKHHRRTFIEINAVLSISGYLRPELTMAAGMETPRNAAKPLMKPGKFCEGKHDVSR